MSDTLVLNLYAGPGTGKSTTCAGVFSWLKNKGVNCEVALEVAKDFCWENSPHLLANQIYIFGLQHHRIHRLLGQVDVIITDAPLLHSVIYDSGKNEYLTPLVLEEHLQLNSLDVFLQRVKPFNPKGRVHDEEQSRAIDKRILDLLEYHYGKEGFLQLPGEWDSIPKIGEAVLERLK